MLLVWIKFAGCVALVLVSGTKLSRYGCAIAEKTGLGRVWIGVILLATATSLPEVVTAVGSVTVVRIPDLAMGTLVGSNLFNLLIIAVLDVLYRPAPLLTRARAGASHLLSAGIAILLIALAGVGITFGGRDLLGEVGWVGGYSIVLVILYLVGTGAIFRFERTRNSDLAEPGIVELSYRDISARKAYLGYTISAIVIVASGIWLATLGADIARNTGWNASFVGTLFLAITTSLPEMTVSITALRLGAIDMAIANMLGSNMFNMGIGLVISDLFYRQGTIFAHISRAHIFTILGAIVMTAIVIAGLVVRPKRKTPLRVSWYAIGLVIIFLVAAYIAFTMGIS